MSCNAHEPHENLTEDSEADNAAGHRSAMSRPFSEQAAL